MRCVSLVRHGWYLSVFLVSVNWGWRSEGIWCESVSSCTQDTLSSSVRLALGWRYISEIWAPKISKIDFLLIYNVGRPLILKVSLSLVHCCCIWKELAVTTCLIGANWFWLIIQLVSIKPFCISRIVPHLSAMNSAQRNL